jgi:hypothetical protein
MTAHDETPSTVATVATTTVPPGRSRLFWAVTAIALLALLLGCAALVLIAAARV